MELPQSCTKPSIWSRSTWRETENSSLCHCSYCNEIMRNLLGHQTGWGCSPLNLYGTYVYDFTFHKSVQRARCKQDIRINYIMTSLNGNISRVTGNFTCALINGWVNNGEAGDLRRHRAHYVVIVMYMPYQTLRKKRRYTFLTGSVWTQKNNEHRMAIIFW